VALPFHFSVATIAHHQADMLAVLAPILTAICVEATLGTTEGSIPSLVQYDLREPGRSGSNHSRFSERLQSCFNRRF
jgi:hypothetical protein